MTDRELLARYAADGSAEAFEEIVRRHAGMVYAACRRVLRDAHAAEDAVQATFLVLMRKIPSLSPGTVLAVWLYRAAELSARNAHRVRGRRVRHEREAARMTPESAPEEAAPAWEAVAPRLDEALASLPKGPRDALILRYLQGLPRARVAEELGRPEGTVQTWLHRGLERLRARLARRGVAVSGAVLAAFLTERTADAAPAALPAAVAAACLGKAPASAAAVGIAEACVRSMVWVQVKAAAAVLALAVAGAASVPFAARALEERGSGPAAAIVPHPAPFLVRPVYFLGSDEPEPPGVRPKMQTAFALVRRFFAEEMRRNGYGYREFNLEPEPGGRPRIHVIRGREPAAFYAGNPLRIQAELEGIFDRDRSVVAVAGRTGGWAGGPSVAPGGRGGFCYTDDPLRWLAETEEGQMAILRDRRPLRDAGLPDGRPWQGLRAEEIVARHASLALGTMMNGLVRGFGAQTRDDPLDVVVLGYLGAANYFTGQRVVWNESPRLSPGLALHLDNSPFFRAGDPGDDAAGPVLDVEAALAVPGEPIRFRISGADEGTGPAVLSVEFDGIVRHTADLRSAGNPFSYACAVPPGRGLSPGTYPVVVHGWDRAGRKAEARSWFRVARALPPLPPAPVPDPSEAVYVEDSLPPGTVDVQGAWLWDSAYRASGARGIVHPTEAGRLTTIYFIASPEPLPVAAGDALTAYVCIAPGAAPEMISLSWFTEEARWSPVAYWGADRLERWHGGLPARVRMGDLPAAGGWVRLEVEGSLVRLEGKTVRGIDMTVHGGGDVFWDRLGKRGVTPAE